MIRYRVHRAKIGKRTMKTTLFTATSAALLLVFSVNAQAEDATYTLEYSATSPIKDLSLKNATLKLEVYRSEKPGGYEKAITDTNQSFTLDKKYDLEVVGIQGEEKLNARCSGSGTTTDPKIMITCNPKAADNPTEEIED